jgi:hypothetical protein
MAKAAATSLDRRIRQGTATDGNCVGRGDRPVAKNGHRRAMTRARAGPVILRCSARRRVGDTVRRIAGLVPIVCALAGFAAAPTHSRIQFADDSTVPRSVQEFAWRVIETRCNYQPYERERRSFWAYDARARRIGADVVYSINVLSELTWKKTETPAVIEMTVVNGGRMQLTALRSSFAVCAS